MKPTAPHEPIALRRSVTTIIRPAAPTARQLIALDAPATQVMTDFDRNALVVVNSNAPIDDGLLVMKQSGVRSAFVIDAGGTVLGLVTAYDIQGEKPLRRLEQLGCTLRSCTRKDVTVTDVMEPSEQWRVIDYKDLETYRVRDIVDTLRSTGRSHVPVVERTHDGADRLRGMLSATEVSRVTGVNAIGLRTAASFAEIEQALEHGELS